MDAALTTLFSPVILFFVLGILAAVARSDLAIPESLAKGMSLYLMAAIGLKGGVQVAAAGFSTEILLALLAGAALSALLPILAFPLLKTIGGIDALNAGAVAAHYGSVSVVTYVTGVEILTAANMIPDGYMVAVLALMETPAILVGIWLARRGVKDKKAENRGGNGLLHEVLFNGSVVLLVGSFLIGIVGGEAGFEPIAPLFEGIFKGVLCLFLLDMGLIAARRLIDSRALNARLVTLGIVLPIVNGTIGAAVAGLIGLSGGTAVAFVILAASASYIAVPAAMRMAMPQADAGLYLSLSLGVTFPFNITLGIPYYIFIVDLLIGSTP
ncbi:MAG: sodium-dependent bicarbonate transport family permease [Pacificimonas sp.]